MIAEQTFDQRKKCLSCLRKNERVGFLGPLQLETGCLSRDPDLTHRRVRRNDELARPIFKKDIHHAVIVLELEAGRFVFSGDQGLLENFQGFVRFTTKSGFIQHVFECISFGGLAQFDALLQTSQLFVKRECRRR
jgi:hypothetical protein